MLSTLPEIILLVWLCSRIAALISSTIATAAVISIRSTGRTRLPTLTLRGIHDQTAFVELAHSYQQIREAAGTADQLVQVYTDERGHSYLSDPEYRAALAALLDWLDQGTKPTPTSVAERCEQAQAPG